MRGDRGVATRNRELFNRAYQAALTRLIANERVVSVATLYAPTDNSDLPGHLILTVITEPVP